jgi:2-beta-glucuronyltransferase
MKVVLMTGHVPDSDRKTGFHFWMRSLNARRNAVDWITVGFSYASAFKKQARPYAPPFNAWIEIGPYARKFSWKPLFHPFRLPSSILNTAATPLFSLYPALLPDTIKDSLASAQAVIVENGAGLMLIPAIRALNPAARIVYTVSDRLKTLNYHPLIEQAEKAAIPIVDMIRVPAQAMIKDFPPLEKVLYVPQGLDKEAFDLKHPSPYKAPKNIISVGDMLFDAHAVETLAGAAPDWTFHVFGRKAKTQATTNIILHGEQAFETIIPYLQHADLGLAPYRPAPEADYLSQSSLKMTQYTYCRLPIIAPHFAAAGRPHVIGYTPDNQQSLEEAIRKAIAYDRKSIDTGLVITWDEVIDLMLNIKADDDSKNIAPNRTSAALG